ncbi:hypothetical protein BDV29DRAFT_183653 [Aspergillus leporis]|uniref:Uncharacterized protein n=1 Tax=Aspergillus leporis TaxID=41062 RepID=A0A5N5WK99_9EURO|nr:hypothetical protein BDV29DRAFT_183653 [Aspergillus leporis]
MGEPEFFGQQLLFLPVQTWSSCFYREGTGDTPLPDRIAISGSHCIEDFSEKTRSPSRIRNEGPQFLHAALLKDWAWAFLSRQDFLALSGRLRGQLESKKPMSGHIEPRGEGGLRLPQWLPFGEVAGGRWPHPHHDLGIETLDAESYFSLSVFECEDVWALCMHCTYIFLISLSSGNGE